MKRVVLVALIVSAAFMASCNKDDDDKDNGNGKVKLLETVSCDGTLELKYEYDEQDRIKKKIIYEDDGKTVYGTDII